jgi:orotidine-5'-phosphate decarboxylase
VDVSAPGILALDQPSWPAADRLVRALGEAVPFYKVGLELFTAEGPAVVRELKGHGKRIFLDLKLHDIPNTVAGAAKSAAALGAEMLTVHAAGGPAMVRAAVEAAGGTKILAVTVLTSLAEGALPASFPKEAKVEDLVVRLAEEALQAGAHGLVCSGAEVRALRTRFGPAPLLVVPGTRPHGAGHGDQARVVSPKEALDGGASWLVVGRAVTSAADPLGAWRTFWSFT